MLTSAVSLRLLRGQIAYLADRGFNVELLCGDDVSFDHSEFKDTPVTIVPMGREISLFRDLFSVFHTVKALRRIRPHIINVSTPKAGLIGSIAAAIARVPVRIYTLRGLRYETASGLKRFILKSAERIACSLSHRVICVSLSLRQRAVTEGLVRPRKCVVFARGSSNGVDTCVYRRNPEEIPKLQRFLGLPPGARVIGFVGRLTRDKGVAELVTAFQSLTARFLDLYLLLVGNHEEGDPLPLPVRQAIENNPRIVMTGFVRSAAPFYSAMDVLALPTYREGFPNASLEAQSCGIPVVTTTATGAIDSIVHGVTGLSIPPRDPSALTETISTLLSNDHLREVMGRNARAWVEQNFRPELIWEALQQEYLHQLQTLCADTFSVERLCNSFSVETDEKAPTLNLVPPYSMREGLQAMASQEPEGTHER